MASRDAEKIDWVPGNAEPVMQGILAVLQRMEGLLKNQHEETVRLIEAIEKQSSDATDSVSCYGKELNL